MKRLFFAMMLCVSMLTMWAVPAKRITMRVEQPDGTVLTLTQRGDEHFHYLMTEDGVVVKPNGNGYYYADIADGKIVATKRLAHGSEARSHEEKNFVEALPGVSQLYEVVMHSDGVQRARAAHATQRASEVPTSGEVYVPILLVQYSDVKFSTDKPEETFGGHVNGDDYTDEGGYGSIKEFFEDQSGGKFMPKFDVIGPITLDKTMKYYGENGPEEGDIDVNARQMVKDACLKADADFSRYDNNGDGYVDIVYIIYAGYGEASNTAKLENTVWPHQSWLVEPLSLDGVKISKYACNNELDGYQGTTLDGIGTFCHEFSHCLGLPDFYDTGNLGAFGMNAWSIMDYGCYNDGGHTPCGYTGYELDFLGWRDLIVIDESMDVTLTPLSEGGSAYKIVNDANPDEFYVVENHKKTKWDQFVPAEGMLVIHVDYLASAWQNNILNNDPAHQRMTIIPADNKLNQNTLTGDTYPGTSKNIELTMTSTPAATTYSGEFMKKDITDISMSGSTVTFSFMKGALGVPVLDEVSDVTESGFTATWRPVSGVKEYEVQLSILEEDPYMLAEDFDKVEKGSSDISSILDSYTIQKGWQAYNIYGLDGAIRMGTASSEGALVTPYLRTDSTRFTIIYTVRKSAASDNNAGMVLCVTDDEWLDEQGYNELYGFILTVDNDEWVTYFSVMDTIGKNSYLYMDTRDYNGSPEVEAKRIDIDEIYVVEGDISEQLMGGDAPAKVGRKVVADRNTPMRVAKDVDVAKVVSMNRTAYAMANEEDTTKQKRYRATPVFATRTDTTAFRFDELDGGLYRCTVRSVRDSIYSRSSNPIDVEIVDSMLPQTTVVPDMYIDKDSVYIQVNDSTVSVFYTLDGTLPTSYSTRYEGPFALNEKVTLSVTVRKAGHRRSDVYGERNWFAVDGATYRISSDITPEVYLSEGMGGNASDSYAGDYVVPVRVTYDSLTFRVVGLENATFRNATSLRSVEVSGDSLIFIGDALFHGCTALNAVVWNANLPLPASAFDDKSYTHLLVYLPAGMNLEHPLVDASRMAVVKDGKCEKLTLHDQKPFYCPIPFTAKHVTYKHFYAQSTGLGSSAGWETLALPFDVAQIRHEGKGDIAPFGVDATYNFWLAEPADGGFDPTMTIRANKPYIIAMPNHTVYGNDLLNGNVVFSADNVQIHATDELVPYHGTEYSMIPSFDEIKRCDSVYALNVSLKFDEYAAGSVFVPNRKDVMPFSAYMIPAEKNQGAPMFRILMRPEAEDVVYSLSVTVAGGIVYVTLPEERVITVYDMVGRKVCVVNGQEGVNELSHLPQGMYMIEKTKVYVKR